MTLPYLCAFPDSWELASIESLGFKGIRFDIRNEQQISGIRNLKKHPGLSPLVIIRQYDKICIPVAEEIAKLGRGAIELGNETNLSIEEPAWSPDKWVQFSRECYPAIKAEELHGVKIPVVSGGISNLNKDQLKYLEKSVKLGLKCDIIGYHRYQTEKPPSSPLKDYKNRADELKALKKIAGLRPIWCTETGYHTAPQKKVTYTDAQIASFAPQEFAMHEAGGAEVMAWYTFKDGPSGGYEDRFGIRTFDGVYKPVSKIWKELA